MNLSIKEIINKYIDTDYSIENKNLNFNRFLFELHYKRGTSIDDRDNDLLIKFLLYKYNSCKDIRYLNELLYFRNINNKFLKEIDESFKKHISKSGTHLLPVYNKKNKKKTYLINKKKIKKIALLGPPHFFNNIYKILIDKGYKVYVINIPFYTEPFRNKILSSKFLIKIYEIIYKINIPYKSIDLKYDSDSLNNYLNHYDFDIGVSKLGFIVKENIYSCFKYGLIHDHGAQLPHFRGRSVIEYSILHGCSITSSIHFINKSIDGGDIVNSFIYSKILQQYKSINRIKKFYKDKFTERIIQTIDKINNNDINVIENNFKDGLTYYSIHPKLKNYINHNILNNENFNTLS
tara:strand:+ start:3895 stop:4941 length:1047 start_codon:yes stop_codon:yes gene_type:complete